MTKIPSIAYTVPDLEALATIQLTDVNSGDVVGCVQVTLSNGHTAHQDGVVWGTVALALLALFSSMLHSIIAKSKGAAQWRVIDVMLAIQLPAIASLLSLNYPTVFVEYGTNFAWSIGLLRLKSLQESITKTRANTGGHDTAIYGTNLTAQIATRLSPYVSGSDDSNGSGSSATTSAVTESSLHLRNVVESSSHHLKPTSSYASIKYHNALAARQVYAPNTGPDGQLIGGGANISLPIVTANPSDNGGISVFAERLYIAPGNAFLTVLTAIFILLAILLAALIFVYIIALITRALSNEKHHSSLHWSQRILKPGYFLGTITLATLGRFLMVTFPIFFIFAFYQWDFGDSWVGHLIAGIFTVFFLGFAIGFLYPMIRHAHSTESGQLYYDESIPNHHQKVESRTWGQMAHMYRPRFYWFSAVFLGYSIIRACFISFAQGYGTRQAIGLLVLEVLLFFTLCIFRVGRDKRSDFVFIFMCFTRIACWAVCIAFIPQANVRTIPRVIVGFVLLAVTALPIVFLFFLTLWDLISPFIHINRRRKNKNQFNTRKDEKQEMEQISTTTSTMEESRDRAITEVSTESSPAIYNGTSLPRHVEETR